MDCRRDRAQIVLAQVAHFPNGFRCQRTEPRKKQGSILQNSTYYWANFLPQIVDREKQRIKRVL
jgi:hypothetical protein